MPELHTYRGRIAPTPTGLLHKGHAHTFWTAYQRSLAQQGTLVLRDEDLDPQRCKPEFAEAFITDLKWLDIEWQEGPDVGGPCGPYIQSQRLANYREAWSQLAQAGYLYPCSRSRKDLQQAVTAPHDEAGEIIFPNDWRPAPDSFKIPPSPEGTNWRFRVPDGETIAFTDLKCGPQSFVAGADFGDFLVWRRDDIPAYELAVVVDDIAMDITEVVRGEDLLKSTARQILIYRALQAASIPRFYHCPLVTDSSGQRLAKRHQSLSLKTLREQGVSPETCRSTTTLR